MPPASTSYKAYKRVDVETASQGKLIVMLFNGAIQRAEEARRQLSLGRREGVHNNLLRAQDIMAELRGALNMKAGQIAVDLDRIYEYVQHLLISANVRKDDKPIKEAVTHMTVMRDTWQEAFGVLSKEESHGGAVPSPPRANPGGASVVDFQG